MLKVNEIVPDACDRRDVTNVFFSSPPRLTDPIPTTETSITPRQRPKAGQTQPNPGILPIQPALTPRKRPTAQVNVQAPGERGGRGLSHPLLCMAEYTQPLPTVDIVLLLRISSQNSAYRTAGFCLHIKGLFVIMSCAICKSKK